MRGKNHVYREEEGLRPSGRGRSVDGKYDLGCGALKEVAWGGGNH